MFMRYLSIHALKKSSTAKVALHIITEQPVPKFLSPFFGGGGRGRGRGGLAAATVV